MKKIYLIIALLFFGVSKSYAATMDQDILEMQQRWALIKYKSATYDQKIEIAELAKKAEQVTEIYAGKPEPMIWQAIILSTQAGIDRGPSALGKAKKARELLLEAEKINPNALEGSIYTSLGSLYLKVPGWPIGFGDKKKAREYLEKALTINPNGIDSNFFYGELLFEEKEYDKSVEVLQKALKAKARPNREVADIGRKKEINDLLLKVEEKRKK